MLEGYLYLHLELGSGAIKLRCSNRKLDDGAWHRIDLVRNLRVGSVAVDNDEDVNFETIGEEATLDLGGPLYVGSVDRERTGADDAGGSRSHHHRYYDSRAPRQWVPPALWSASLRNGFVGCLRDLVINQVTVDIADYASKQDSGTTNRQSHFKAREWALRGGRANQKREFALTYQLGRNFMRQLLLEKVYY